MAKLFFNYPLWDFSCFPLRRLLLASPIASATKSALFNNMAASRGGFTECQLELLTLVSGTLFIQTGLDSTIVTEVEKWCFNLEPRRHFYQCKIMVVQELQFFVFWFVLYIGIFYFCLFIFPACWSEQKWLWSSFWWLAGLKDVTHLLSSLFLMMYTKSR